MASRLRILFIWNDVPYRGAQAVGILERVVANMVAKSPRLRFPTEKVARYTALFPYIAPFTVKSLRMWRVNRGHSKASGSLYIRELRRNGLYPRRKAATLFGVARPAAPRPGARARLDRMAVRNVRQRPAQPPDAAQVFFPPAGNWNVFVQPMQGPVPVEPPANDMVFNALFGVHNDPH